MCEKVGEGLPSRFTEDTYDFVERWATDRAIHLDCVSSSWRLNQGNYLAEGKKTQNQSDYGAIYFLTYLLKYNGMLVSVF